MPLEHPSHGDHGFEAAPADPICLGFHERPDAPLRQVERSAYRQPAIPFDDQGNGFATGADDLVNRDGHGCQSVGWRNEPAFLFGDLFHHAVLSGRTAILPHKPGLQALHGV